MTHELVSPSSTSTARCSTPTTPSSAPFVALGVAARPDHLRHLLEDECARLGISVDDYLAHYDDTLAQPFDGVDELLAARPVGGVLEQAGTRRRAELARLGWNPEVALFADAFGGPKHLGRCWRPRSRRTRWSSSATPPTTGVRGRGRLSFRPRPLEPRD